MRSHILLGSIANIIAISTWIIAIILVAIPSKHRVFDRAPGLIQMLTIIGLLAILVAMVVSGP